MTKISNSSENSEGRYDLIQVDLQGLDPTLEDFPVASQRVVKQGTNLAEILVFAIYEFKKNNNLSKTKMSYRDWLSHAQQGGMEYLIYSSYGREIFRVSTIFNPVTEYALYLAMNYHKEQIVRLHGRSYMEHLLEVANTLRKTYLDSTLKDEIIAAALCKDLLAKTACKSNEIEQACGPEALNLVQTISDDSEGALASEWEQRKQRLLGSLKESDVEAVVIAVADKVTQLNTILAQLKLDGPAVWDKIGADKNKELWYNRELLKLAKRRWRHPLVFEFETLLKHFDDNPSSG